METNRHYKSITQSTASTYVAFHKCQKYLHSYFFCIYERPAGVRKGKKRIVKKKNAQNAQKGFTARKTCIRVIAMQISSYEGLSQQNRNSSPHTPSSKFGENPNIPRFDYARKSRGVACRCAPPPHRTPPDQNKISDPISGAGPLQKEGKDDSYCRVAC